MPFVHPEACLKTASLAELESKTKMVSLINRFETVKLHYSDQTSIKPLAIVQVLQLEMGIDFFNSILNTYMKKKSYDFYQFFTNLLIVNSTYNVYI